MQEMNQQVGPFTCVMGDLPETAWVYVCPSCVRELNLKVDADDGPGYACHVKGCDRDASLVHFVWDYRPETVHDHKPRGIN